MNERKGVTRMNIKLDPGAYMPVREHETDAGLDLKAMHGEKIRFLDSAVFDTGLHIELPHGFYAKVESRSGLNIKHSIVTCGGVIDEGYTGSIKVKLYNLGREDYEVRKGDKIAQLIIMPYEAPKTRLVAHLEETDRGSNGFGSTGR